MLERRYSWWIPVWGPACGTAGWEGTEGTAEEWKSAPEGLSCSHQASNRIWGTPAEAISPACHQALRLVPSWCSIAKAGLPFFQTSHLPRQPHGGPDAGDHRTTRDRASVAKPNGSSDREPHAMFWQKMKRRQGVPRTLGTRSAIVSAAILAFLVTGCTDRGSELTIVYRGGPAAERAMVRVRVGSGDGARVVTASFPSAARPERVSTSGELPIEVALLAANGDTIAGQSLPPIRLAPQTAYAVGVAVGRRPTASRCDGPWAGSAIAGRADSLYVSVTATTRAKEQPRCDE